MSQRKKKLFTVELDSDWVLSHRDDDELPIAAIEAEFSRDKTLVVKDSSLTTITVVYSENTSDYTGLKNFVLRFLQSRYPKEKLVGVASFSTENSDEKDEGILGGEAPAEEEKEDFYADICLDLDDLVADKKSERDGISVIEKIDALVGAAEFKALAHEICSVAEEIIGTGTFDVFANRCYLFSIGDGCGLTTYLELLSELVCETRLCSVCANPVMEERVGAYREGNEPFDGVYRALDRGSKTGIKVLCVDISEWLDRTDNRFFKQFLRAVEKHANEFITVFRVPFVDKDILARINYSLSDLLSVKTVSFPPLSRDEIKICAEAELNKYKFTITDAAWKYFFERISEEKSDGKFYGVNTVKKVVRELIYQKHLANAQRADKSKQITVNDAKNLCGDTADSDLSGFEQLKKLVGVESIKKRVEEIVAQIELAVKNKKFQRPCIHMRFVGNPGTGKTTVARIIGKILKEKGVLRVGAFFEYAGRDFCGRYVGETAPKTASICRDAYGSVLFIDEAYSLYRGDGDTKDFGREAIDTLIAEMENHRNDFVVIMAGYNGDMDKLLEGNAGLASRMPYTVEFPNFSRDQLFDIFVSMVKEKFGYEDELFTAAQKYFKDLPEDIVQSKDFSNARYVRNLFERTWAKAAMRCQLNGVDEIVLTRDDFEHASSDKEFAANLPKKTRIGFNN